MISRTIRAGIYRDVLLAAYNRSEGIYEYMDAVCAWLACQQSEIITALEKDIASEKVNLHQYALNWFDHEQNS